MGQRARDPQGAQRRDREDQQDGHLREPHVDRVVAVPVDVVKVGLQRLERGDEGPPRVPAAVGEHRHATGEPEDQQLPDREDAGGQDPHDVVSPGPVPAAQEADDPDDGDGRDQDHHRFPGQRAEGEERGGQPAPPGPDGEQPGEHARGGDRLRGIPAQAGDQPEVPRQEQAPRGVPTALDGEAPADVAQRPDSGDVDRDEHVGHQREVPERDEPGHYGVPDPHEPVGRVDGDAVGRLVEVERIDRQPVIELAVVTVFDSQRHARRQLGRVREVLPDQDEPADAPPGPHLPPGHHEPGGGQQRDQPGNDRPVRPDD